MLGFLLLPDSDPFRHPVELAARTFDPLLRLLLLPVIHLRQGVGKPPAGAMQYGNRHFQFALQGDRGRPGGRRLPLRFQKQFRLGEDALADYARAVPPGGIELSGLPCVATVLDECGGHPLAVVHVDSRHRHQILHRQLRAQQPFPHLLLDRFRQQLDQRQAPRYPTHAAVEAARQLIETVAEALFHLRQQPALLQRAFLRTEAQRPVQQQSFGFAHRPDGGVDRVPAELLERRDALVAVDHQIAVAGVCGQDDHDRRLLARLSQRGNQAPLPVRLADSEMLPSPVELVKLQLHRRLLAVQYGPSRDWSFAAAGEVCRQRSWNQPDTRGTDLSPIGRLVLP